MPKEVNRVVTDRVSDVLLCPSADALENLNGEGIAARKVHLVGNTTIDSLQAMLPVALEQAPHARLGLTEQGYVLVTLHRPALVDDPERLCETVAVLEELAADLPVVFPIHLRTSARLRGAAQRLRLLEPVDCITFLGLQAGARLVITDSGGVQEETSVLGTRCLTYRTTTERPITIEQGHQHPCPRKPAGAG